MNYVYLVNLSMFFFSCFKHIIGILNGVHYAGNYSTKKKGGYKALTVSLIHSDRWFIILIQIMNFADEIFVVKKKQLINRREFKCHFAKLMTS